MDFLIKKIISAVLMPIPLVVILLLIGIYLWQKKPQIALALQFGAILLLLGLSSNWGANQLAKPLERAYPVWQSSGSVQYIHVLGSGHHSQRDRTALQALTATALARLMEGIRIWRLNPHAKLIVSGYAGLDYRPHAEILKLAAIELGVPANKIVTLPTARDTREEAQLAAYTLGNSTVVLVTSAVHMRRSVNEFDHYGVRSMPAATDFIARPGVWYRFSSSNFEMSERAWHEYLGLAWQWIHRIKQRYSM